MHREREHMRQQALQSRTLHLPTATAANGGGGGGSGATSAFQTSTQIMKRILQWNTDWLPQQGMRTKMPQTLQVTVFIFNAFFVISSSIS